MYPARIFTVIDRREPDDWISEVGEDGERYAYSPPLNGVGFWDGSCHGCGPNNEFGGGTCFNTCTPPGIPVGTTGN